MYKANYIIRVFYSNCIWKLVTIYNIKIYNISKFCMGHKSSCVLFTEVKAVQLLPFSPFISSRKPNQLRIWYRKIHAVWETDGCIELYYVKNNGKSQTWLRVIWTTNCIYKIRCCKSFKWDDEKKMILHVAGIWTH